MEAAFNAPSGCVDDNVLISPGVVLPTRNFFPARKLQSRNIRHPRFHPATMFYDV